MIGSRDAAFLAEMGITPLWQARRGPDTAVQAAAGAGAAADDLDPLARLDWRGLNEAVARCERCGCKGGASPSRAVLGEGARAAVWLVAAGATSSVDEAARQPVAGPAGALLDNMLAAVQLSREENVYVTNLVKCRPVSASGGERAPTADEIAACRPFVERELALCGAGVVLTLGQVAANALLDQPLQSPLSAVRGAVHEFGGATLVATLHPAELLGQSAAKAEAWADLCLARTAAGLDHGQR